MLDPAIIYDSLNQYGFNLAAGVPCSFLKNLINCSIDKTEYISAANEGEAIAIASGVYLGGKKAVVLMQNSGLGNAVSPLTSLNQIYEIPVLMFISQRGDKTIKDAPQHELMGEITTDLLDLMKIKWEYLSDDIEKAIKQIEKANGYYNSNHSFAFVVSKNTFSPYELSDDERLAKSVKSNIVKKSVRESYPSRPEAIIKVTQSINDQIKLISSTGYISRELYSIKDRSNNFYMMGSLGCVSSVALGLSITAPKSKIIVLDGDGSLLMRMGSLAINAYYGNSNLLHILFDNHCHLSTGAQSTVSGNLDFIKIAGGCGYPRIREACNLNEFSDLIEEWLLKPKLTFLYLKVNKSTMKDLKRPEISPTEITKRFMNHD